jgi:hypothetical protein
MWMTESHSARNSRQKASLSSFPTVTWNPARSSGASRSARAAPLPKNVPHTVRHALASATRGRPANEEAGSSRDRYPHAHLPPLTRRMCGSNPASVRRTRSKHGVHDPGHSQRLGVRHRGWHTGRDRLVEAAEQGVHSLRSSADQHVRDGRGWPRGVVPRLSEAAPGQLRLRQRAGSDPFRSSVTVLASRSASSVARVPNTVSPCAADAAWWRTSGHQCTCCRRTARAARSEAQYRAGF